MVGRYKKTGFPYRKIISLRKVVSDLRPIDILTGEIASQKYARYVPKIPQGRTHSY
jgi:hypothetical protein